MDSKHLLLAFPFGANGGGTLTLPVGDNINRLCDQAEAATLQR